MPNCSFLAYYIRLPEIQDELQNSIERTRESLDLLPKAPSQDPFNEIMNLLHVFTRDLSQHLVGVPDDDGLLQTIRPAHESFRKAIRITAPDFRPYERRYATQRSLPKAEFLSNEEEQEDASSGSLDSGHEPPPLVSSTSTIYIDEVYDRALK